MAADIPSSDSNKRGGSDLDIFEGLGKKANSAPVSRGSSIPPPPPRSMPTNPPMIIKNDVGKKTLVGMAPGIPQQAPVQPVRLPAPPSRSAPPPPPGRGSLPQVVPPPRARRPPAGRRPPPPSRRPPRALGTAWARPPRSRTRRRDASAAPPATAAKAGLDMDWDDEDEATHVFDKMGLVHGGAERADRRPARPAAGTPLAPPVKSTLLGMTQPLQMPRRRPRLPRVGSAAPPPSSLNAAAAAVGAPPATRRRASAAAVVRGADDPDAGPVVPAVPPADDDAADQHGADAHAWRPRADDLPSSRGPSRTASGIGPALPPVSALASPPMPSRMEAT